MSDLSRPAGVFGPDCDFPEPVTPTRFFLVAFSPRSASTFLCHQLWRTGLLGAPDEYFDLLTNMPDMICRLGTPSIAQYIQALFDKRTSPNGVFGFKANQTQFELLRSFNLLRNFPQPSFIYVDRRDRLAQAVSLAKAWQTNRWHSFNEERGRPEYDFKWIRTCLKAVVQQGRYWEAYFSRHHIRPYRVDSQQLISEPAPIVKDVLEYLGITSDPEAAKFVPTLPELTRVSDATNVEWIRRFTVEARKAGLRLGRHLETGPEKAGE